MEREEYQSAKVDLYKRHKMEIFDLEKRYALANNPYHVGDILTDSYQTGKVTSLVMGRDFDSGTPVIDYNCIKYTKAGRPAKRMKNITICQSNVKSCKSASPEVPK